MKVNGSPGAYGPIASRNGPREAGEAFAPAGSAGSEHAAPTASSAPANAVGTLEALLTLQEADPPVERRKRAVRRAGRILDALDELKLSVLDPDGLDASVLTRLQSAVQEARSQTDDPRLEALLEEIETRAAVEMAKRELRAAA